MISKEIKHTYQLVVGLEVHAQLATRSKIFSPEQTTFGSAPNTNVSAISLGHPGVMPMLNRKVVELAIRMGLACKSEITRFQYFDRKNYFYPDLPKGYQMTQDKTPICVGGTVKVSLEDGTTSEVILNRIHLEEDAGKSIHAAGTNESQIDLNRAGVPLIEIVTEPVIHSAEEAGAFLTEVRKIVRFLDICDGNMEEGSLRCDANVSVRKKDVATLGKKVEVKNMNSIKNVIKAIHHEMDRQIALLEAGEEIISETRMFDVNKGQTYGMRTKEELNDYRYFPEPDLSPLRVTDAWLEEIRSAMPDLPESYRARFVETYGLNSYDAGVLADQKDLALAFDLLCAETSNYKAAANWMMGPVKSYLNEHKCAIEDFPVSLSTIAELIELIDEGHVSHTAANQQLFPYLVSHTSMSANEAAHVLNLFQESNAGNIQSVIDEIINRMPQKVSEYRKGKKGLMGMFMGEVMKQTNGAVDPKVANQLLRESLDN